MEELQKLNCYKGSGTSIVTLLVPAKTMISNVVNHLNQEIGTASNIKDKSNRKSVIDALKSSIVFFQKMKTIPSTGIATFSGWYV